MEFSYYDLLSINEVVAEVIIAVGDEEQKMLTPGFYRRLVKQGLDELGYETFFNVQYEDIEMPTDLKIPIPSGCFNLQDIFLYQNSNCCDIATLNGTVRVSNKSNFLTKGYTKGYTARNKPNDNDVFIHNRGISSDVHFYNEQNGIIMLSDNCSNYPYVRLVFNGTPSDIDKVKMIPPFVKVGLSAYATERAFFYLKMRDPKYRQAWVDSRADVVEKWRDSVYRLKRMGKKERSDISEYLSKMNC